MYQYQSLCSTKGFATFLEVACTVFLFILFSFFLTECPRLFRYRPGHTIGEKKIKKMEKATLGSHINI